MEPHTTGTREGQMPHVGFPRELQAGEMRPQPAVPWRGATSDGPSSRSGQPRLRARCRVRG